TARARWPIPSAALFPHALPELLFTFEEVLLDGGSVGGDGNEFFEVADGFLKVSLSLFKVRQMSHDLFVTENVSVLFSFFLLHPFFQSQFPKIPSSFRIAQVLIVKAPELYQNGVAVGIRAPAFAQKFFG